MKDKILLCIPGNWQDRTQFITELLAGTDGRFVAAGNFILDRINDFSCEFSLNDPVDGMHEDFWIDPQVEPIPDEVLNKILDHKSFLSLYSNNDGAEEALAISEIALAALDIGGIAVRVEGSKRASSPEQWRHHVQSARGLSPNMLYQLFVWAFVTEDKCYNSIGMTFFGQRDISIETDNIGTANAIYDEFAKYLLFCEPEIHDGHTIEFEGVEGIWRLAKVDHIYNDDPDIDFSRGAWHLQREDVHKKWYDLTRFIKRDFK